LLCSEHPTTDPQPATPPRRVPGHWPPARRRHWNRSWRPGVLPATDKGRPG